MAETASSLRVAAARISGVALAAVIALGAGRQARADVEAFTYNVPTTPTPFSTTINLDLFNTGLGTLTGVNITLNTTIVGTISVFNNTGSQQTITNAFSSVPTSVLGPGPTTASSTATANVASATVPTGFSSITGLTATASDSVNVANVNFALYEAPGGGSLAAGLTATAGTGSFGGSSVPGVYFSGSATAAETITVTYTYTPSVPAVPVPASFLMVGTGLLTAGGTLLRRRGPIA